MTAITNERFPPGPTTDIIGGHILSLRRNPLQFLIDNLEYGSLTHLKFLSKDVYQVNDPELVGKVLRQNTIWHKAEAYKRTLRDYLGNGLLISDGEVWRHQRKLMQPAFHVHRVSTYADTMVTYAEQMVSEWKDGDLREIAHEMMQVTLFIVGKTLFDAELRDTSTDVAAALENMVVDIRDDTLRMIRLPKWLPTRANRRKQQTIEQLYRVVIPIIHARRETGEDTGDLLSMLLFARDDDGNGMSDQQILDECLTLVLAGHETTANTLTWVLYLLAKNPTITEKLYAEVDEKVGSRRAGLSDLTELPYSEQVIKEAMRLYPPVWIFGRRAVDATELGGYPIERGGVAVMPIWALHHNEQYFPDPWVFRPERWTPENESEIPRYAYLPFGGGPRICIGNGFAMMEARLILVTLLQQVNFSLIHPEIEPEPLVTLRPKGGMPMRLSRR